MQDRPASGLALIGAALRESAALLRATIALARAEIAGNRDAVLRLFGLLGTILVLMVAAFFVLLDALVKLLAALIGSEVIAASLVACPFVAVAVVLGSLGLRRIARATTPRTAKGTVQAAT